MIFIIGGREQGKTAYAMELWKKRTLERRKKKDLSTVLNLSKIRKRIELQRASRTGDWKRTSRWSCRRI